MVVCPCGVMVPAAGVGRARRGNRGPTGCFDSPATVTTQPKEPQDTPASVEKLAAAAAQTTEPSSIPRPLSRGGKNKGPCKGSEDVKADHASRTTLALATTESGRYVGTRPLRSNRSPTPTLHRLPQKISRDNSAGGTAGGGRLTKHLPAVRTSPTSPLDNHDSGAPRGARLKGPTALPRQNSVNNAMNQRMNDINSNQRRLLKQTNATQLRNPAANPATKTCQDPDHCNTTNAHAPIYENLSHTRTGHWDGAKAHEGIYESHRQTRLGDCANAREYFENITHARRREEGAKSHEFYKNVHHTRTGEGEVIYENVSSLCVDTPTGRPADECSGDVTGKQMKSSADSLTPDESLVWLSDSWKYNTIKKAPEFNIFEFSDIDTPTQEIDGRRSKDNKETSDSKRKMKSAIKEMNETGKGDSARKIEMTLEKGKKKLRSKLPLFGWKSDRQNKDKENKDKENKGGVDPAIKTLQTSGQVLKPDNKRTPAVPHVPESPVSIHRSKIQKPSTCNASFGLKDFQRIDKEDANLCQAERGRGGASKSPAGQIRFVKKGTYMDHDMGRTSRSPSTSPVKSRHPRKPDHFEQTGQEKGGRDKSGNMSRGLPSCASPLISPGHHRSSLSSQMAQPARGGGRGGGGGGGVATSTSSSSMSSSSSNSSLPLPSPSPYKRQVSQKVNGGNLALDKNLFSSSSTLSSSSSRSPSLITLSSSSSMECMDVSNQEIPKEKLYKIGKLQEKEKENIPASWSPSGTSSRHSHLPGPEGNIYTNEQERSQHTQRSKLELETDLESGFNRVSSQVPHYLTSSNLDIRKHTSIASYNTIPRHQKMKRNTTGDKLEIQERRATRKREPSPISPYNSIPKKERRMRNIENEKGDKDADDRGERERPASFTRQDTKDLPSRPESSEERKKRYNQSGSEEASRSWKEYGPSSHDVRKYSPALPSPTPSCPPSVEERQTAAPFQYHSLPQLYLGGQDCLVSQQPLERDPRSDVPSSRPYYMGDLYRSPLPGISRNRRYSQTSLIDQALESLEFSSLVANVSQTSPKSKRYSLVPSTSQTLERCLVSSSAKSAATSTSPVLPPLPVGVLDRESPPLESKKENECPSPEEAKTNLASVCLLSFDLTVDCEEFSTNGFNVVNITNNTLTDHDLDEIKYDYEEKTFEISEEELLDDIKTDEKQSKDEDTVSVRSGSLSIDEKYYENDDYDNTDDNPCNFISEEQQRQLDQSLAILSEMHYNNIQENSVEKMDPKITDDNDDEDFIEIDCDVKPMETLKRPLVYGYGNGPVRSFQGKSFMEKRLSQASVMSEYMEMDIEETLCKMGGNNEVQKKSESCMNLKETYWDYWQAKQGIIGQSNYQTSSRNSSKNCSPRTPSCPSERFCYDPEVLLAHVRCPKSLEDATFKQYSAYVKSHIYDHFGNVQEALNDYGLSNAHRDWMCSQPDLLPGTPRHCQASGNLPLDYSSEPELTNGSARDPSHRIPHHFCSKRAPPPRPPPSPLHSKDPSQDSGNWTYLHSSQESESGFAVPGTYPVPLPRSTSSLSHVGPVTYDPWRHLLPDVTPPRTPRHSLYYPSVTSRPASRSASPSPNRGSLASMTATPETTRTAQPSHHISKGIPKASVTPMTQQPSGRTTIKRSFFPSLSKVVRSPLRKSNLKSKTCGREDSMDVLSDLPTVHPSIQKRTHTTTSSKSSSSSSSSSSASSKDSVTTVIPATARNKGPNWLMRHFGGAKPKMAAV